MRRLITITVALETLAWSDAVAQQSIEGRWQGALRDGRSELQIAVTFANTSEGFIGKIDVPNLYMHEFALANVKSNGDDVSFDLPLGQQADVFQGKLERERLEGSFRGRLFGGATKTATFVLARAASEQVYRKEDARIQNATVTLAGTLFLPPGVGPHPAIVLVHGSGPQTRESYLRFFAHFFARIGIAALIYDKRGTGQSTGEIWYKTGDRFEDLAADAAAGVAFLRARPDIDGAQIGLWGLSQGAWIAPVVASRDATILHVMVVSGGGVTPAEQEIYDDEVKLRDRGFPADQVQAAVSLLKVADDVIRRRVSWDEFEVARKSAERTPWFDLLDKRPLTLPREDPWWQSGTEGLDFDPIPLWRRSMAAVLAIFGSDDKSTPAPESARRLQKALEGGARRKHRVLTFRGADHALWVAPRDGGAGWPRPADGWLEAMERWVRGTVTIRAARSSTTPQILLREAPRAAR